MKEEALGILRSSKLVSSRASDSVLELTPEAATAQPSPKFWLWPNLLSLDAPLVAVVWQVLFVRCFHVASDAVTSILLVTSVWLIYAADRALDAWRGELSSPRHRFYRDHWRILLPIWTAVLAASAWLALTELPIFLLRRGCVLLGVVIVYFVIVHGVISRAPRSRLSAWWSKEASVGFVFALGASLAAWANVRTLADGAAIALFFALCWINCAAIQNWESGLIASSAKTPWPVSVSAACVALVAGVLLCMDRPVLGGAELASACAFVWLDRARRRFSPDAVRVLADVALLSPMIFLPLVRGA